MKLLLDENLSHRLATRLEAAFPGTVSVDYIGLRGQLDTAIWDHAAGHGFAIVSKDEDLRQLSFFRGHPPKVIWLAVGNVGTDQIADLLLRNKDRIITFLGQNEDSLLTLDLIAREE